MVNIVQNTIRIFSTWAGQIGVKDLSNSQNLPYPLKEINLKVDKTGVRAELILELFQQTFDVDNYGYYIAREDLQGKPIRKVKKIVFEDGGEWNL